MRLASAAAAVFLLVVKASAGQAAPESETAGKQAFSSNCSFCHGANAQGGAQGGPNLTQSALVRGDVGGRQLGAFLKVGRPDKGMPAFNLPEQKVQAIAAFLRTEIRASMRRPALGNEVLVGDPAAGKAFFDGAGHCKQCHSESGDLKGIGSRYPPAVLQGRMVLPIGSGGYPGFSPAEASYQHVKVTEPGGKKFAGRLIYLSDYFVTLEDAAGERRTLPRSGDLPEIQVEDPLQAHLDLETRLTDKQMHDLTAYLASLR